MDQEYKLGRNNHMHLFGEMHFTNDVSDIRDIVIDMLSKNKDTNNILLLENYQDDYMYYQNKFRNTVDIRPLESSIDWYIDFVGTLPMRDSFVFRETYMVNVLKQLLYGSGRVVVVLGDTHLRETKEVKELGPSEAINYSPTFKAYFSKTGGTSALS